MSDSHAGSLPAWADLPERSRGTLVAFFRTAELESSFDYAAEHFPPAFPADSVLGEVTPATLSDIYWGDYKALSPEEFGRLYDLA
jgi:hypothetical protein